ncbi:branched-chain amino acid transport system ATP-binding protein [Haloarcula quadrata]|uniref:Branched-chain amino acid transport system ATP-binding protein n=1 Tax=Haloarcula quadrata TaxID=182779 RepID=A0A495QQB4_9EURY|nr:ABC transporter ATP-binding protein [Haloarcula quadrata]RKS75174.1 branched-chain amino acid transport system ATP-binding protein [Haloarcula quadrata]
MSLLDIQNLDAGYGDLQILTDIDLSVDEGEYVSIVGPNGAGKSTVMKTIVGIASHLGGEISYRGSDVSKMPPEEVIREGIAYVPQTANIFPSLSIDENLRLGAYVLDEVPTDRQQAIYNRFQPLSDRRNQQAGSLSGGQRQMLAMGCALMLDPDLLLLDEPSAGLAPNLVDDMFDRIDDINDAGTTILMVEQNAKEALQRCDRGYVLANGQNRDEGPGNELLHDEEVRQRFLGG